MIRLASVSIVGWRSRHRADSHDDYRPPRVKAVRPRYRDGHLDTAQYGVRSSMATEVFDIPVVPATRDNTEKYGVFIGTEQPAAGY